MNISKKWYDNKGLLTFLIIFIYPIGLIGIWISDRVIVKKIVYSFVGFFVWIFASLFTLLILAGIFIETNYYARGNEYYNEKTYGLALDSYERVPNDDENYAIAQQKIKEIKAMQEKERKARLVFETTAINEVKENVAGLIRGKDTYSVILYDMDVQDVGKAKEYQHKYKVVLEDKALTPYDTITQWIPVTDTTFDYYAQDLEMELLSKNQNEEIKNSAPPGYNRYVGNSRYGEWKADSNGDSFWEFYGKYAFLRSMFGYQQPIYNYGYYDYVDNYKGKSSYYGRSLSSGRYAYGTTSPHTQGKSGRSAFASKVQGRVNQSSTNQYTSRSKFTTRVRNSTSRSSYSAERSLRYSSAGSRSSSSRGGK